MPYRIEDRGESGIIIWSLPVNGNTVNVVVEHDLVPLMPECEFIDWVTLQASDAIANSDDGQQRYFAPWQGNQPRWVFRVWHDNGDVSINRAPGNPFPPENTDEQRRD